MTTKSDARIRADLKRRGRVRSRGIDMRPVIEIKPSLLERNDSCIICKAGKIQNKGGAFWLCGNCGQRYKVWR